ncbi:MAG: hypothetical protein DRP87_17715 [Spirochaetes bacterium]|nr:MAG: hypothetical protein DRP87_17715 [Spirochaetota bacterium]
MEKAGDILKRFFQKSNIDFSSNFYSFFRSWSHIAGEDLSAHSDVVDINNNTVIVEVDHPGWMQMLQMNQKSLLREIKKMYPELHIKEIRFRLRVKEKEKGREKIRAESQEKRADDLEFKQILERLRALARKPDVDTEHEK